MTTNKDRTIHYKPSLVGADTWTIMCPINTYTFERKLSVDDAKSRVLRTHLLIHCNIRFPDEIADSFIEIAIWQSDESIIADDIDEDYTGVGVFHSLNREAPDNLLFKEFQPNQRGNFHLAIPVDSDTLREFGDVLVQTEGNTHLHREIHAEVAGLLNEWDGKGNLCVTNLSLVVSGREQHDENYEA